MRVIALAAALLLFACERPAPERETVGTAKPMDMELLDEEIGKVAERARPAAFDVGVLSMDGGESWSLNTSRTFPLQSVFKAPLGAVVLSEVDRGRLSLDEVIDIPAQDLSPPYSPISANWPGRTKYTVGELLVRAVGDSDNTAADVLMRRIGGPGIVQAWLDEQRIRDMRIDRYERELQTEIYGMPSFRPQWRHENTFLAALNRVPPAERRAAMERYLTEPRDTATVAAALNFLQKLSSGQLLSPKSTQLLLRIMTETKTGQARLKAGLPEGATLAHKTGTGRTDRGINPATNDIGIITLEDGRRYGVAVFLAGSQAPPQERDAIIADVARAVVKAAG
ncbi:MAG TPA: class A beta-lactamase [Caulobacteraceae bacterium]|nr:class A beta-lactamase [Caulobacteraceae bacterium]